MQLTADHVMHTERADHVTHARRTVQARHFIPATTWETTRCPATPVPGIRWLRHTRAGNDGRMLGVKFLLPGPKELDPHATRKFIRPSCGRDHRSCRNLPKCQARTEERMLQWQEHPVFHTPIFCRQKCHLPSASVEHICHGQQQEEASGTGGEVGAQVRGVSASLFPRRQRLRVVREEHVEQVVQVSPQDRS